MRAGEHTPKKHDPAAMAALERLLEFRPWMLALAVFLACAIGVAIMEHSRDVDSMWAQASDGEPSQHQR